MNTREIKIIEYNTAENWIRDFPSKNWCLIIISNLKNTNYYDEILRKSIDRNVGFIHAVGSQSKLIHDLADEEILVRSVENYPLPKHTILTTEIENFESGIWFGIYSTENDKSEIKEIIILDVDKNRKEEIAKLINEFEKGYIPK
ncbi:hypothetical protein [Flavobacterium selenitireducens]|uniref:hypothetical protein n=1 Tax=Flavobacterium selenitireducens TaxID=2722704 RepID=UPI00168BB8FD|nr:hypothetical protein [Flavobacterium selenitireducens]MBD3581561.1 hypothetical protein [Flavobacterium selenitireducens]